MRAFASAWPDKTIMQRVVAQIPWKRNLAILDKLAKSEKRKFLKSNLPSIEEIEAALGAGAK